MNLKLLSVTIIAIVCCASLVDSHGHSHDEHDHHHHHEEEVNPSFKYSRQANEQVKNQASHASHNSHGHAHDEPHHDHHHNQKAKPKEVPAG